MSTKEIFITDLKHGFIELIALFGLVFFGLGSVAVTKFYSSSNSQLDIVEFGALSTLIIAVAHGLYITIAIASFSRSSGAYINPAISISMWITRKISSVKLLIYLFMQFAGGILGAAVWRLLFDSPVGVHSLSSNPFTTSVFAGIGLEVLCTFFLALVIFSLIDSESHLMTSFAIGITVFLGSLVSLPFTGGSLNPARSFGPAVMFNEYKDIWIYFVGPILGASIGAITALWIKNSKETNR